MRNSMRTRIAFHLAAVALGTALATAPAFAVGVPRTNNPGSPWYYPDPWLAASPEFARSYAMCESRYRSFDRQSGTYLGFDGVRHRCRW